MNTTRMIAGALTMASLTAAGLGLTAGTAAADPLPGANIWCPGTSLASPPGPGISPGAWDMNVCHTWYRVDPGKGNVPYRSLDGTFAVEHSNLWDGPNPPAGSVRLECGRDLFTGRPIPC